VGSKVIKVGDKVRFTYAGNVVVGQVHEDRGPIGLGGRRLYAVRYELGKDNWYVNEFPAERLEVIESKTPA
jgi:hypothetical protein